MTQQYIEPPQMNAKRFVLLMLVLFGAGLLAMGVSKALIVLTGVGLFDLLFFVSVIAMLLALMRRTTLRYVYAVDEEGVKLAKCYGDKINTMLDLRAYEVMGVAKREKGVDYRKKYRSATLMAPDKKADAVLLYRQDGAIHAALFAPDEQILAALRALKRLREEENAE